MERCRRCWGRGEDAPERLLRRAPGCATSAPRLTRAEIQRLGVVGRRGAIEIFCGYGRLTASLSVHGVAAEGWDVKGGVDLLDPRVEGRVRCLIAAQKVGMLWHATECKMFSIASGAGCLRSTREPSGKSGLTSHQRARVRNASALLHASLRVMRECLRACVACFLENPHSSLLWKTPGLCRLREDAQRAWHETILDLCEFGEVNRKRTRIACVHVDVATLGR